VVAKSGTQELLGGNLELLKSEILGKFKGASSVEDF